MHLRFTESELATLAQMLSLASSVASWNERAGADEEVSAFEQLEAKVLEKIRHSGLDDFVAWDEDKQRHALVENTRPFEFVQECFDEFRNEIFWEDLVLRLTDRDLQRAIGYENWEHMSEAERREHTKVSASRYWEEFVKNGVERLIVLLPPTEG